MNTESPVQSFMRERYVKIGEIDQNFCEMKHFTVQNWFMREHYVKIENYEGKSR